MWLAASSTNVGIAAKALVYAVAATSCCAATYRSALGPCHAPACTAPTSPLSSAAVEAYSALSEDHAPAAANSDPGRGPALSNAECTSGGEAIQTGAVIISR